MALDEEALGVILRIDVNTTITTIHNSKALQLVSKPTESSCARRGTHQIASGNTHSLTRSLARSLSSPGLLWCRVCTVRTGTASSHNIAKKGYQPNRHYKHPPASPGHHYSRCIYIGIFPQLQSTSTSHPQFKGLILLIIGHGDSSTTLWKCTPAGNLSGWYSK